MPLTPSESAMALNIRRDPQSLGTFIAGRLADLGVKHIFSVPGDFNVSTVRVSVWVF